MGRLGGQLHHQCWGCDLLNLPAGDQTVAIVTPERILIQPKDFQPRLYSYQLGAHPQAERVPGDIDPELQQDLEAFLQTATKSLLDNTAGVADGISGRAE
jgi:hypothetical protein